MHDTLKSLGLTYLAQALPTLLDEARQQQVSYDAFLQQALEVEVVGRQQRALERRLRAAHLPAQTRLETFDFTFQPTVSERLVRELAGLAFVQTATNVVLLGPPGVGKTHLASALARRAVEAGHAALFLTLRQFVESIDTAGVLTWRQQARRYVQPRVLVLDEVGYTHLTPLHAQCLFDVVTARYERSATVLTSNLNFSEWGSMLGDDVLATALLDRLLHHAEVLNINGRSYRMKDRVGGDVRRAA